MFKKALRMVGFVVGGLLVALLLAFLLGYIVMILWNWLMPEIFPGVSEITYWQAWGLFILAKILFSSHGHHHNNDKHHPHLHKTNDQRTFKEKFKDKFNDEYNKHIKSECCDNGDDDQPKKINEDTNLA